MKTPSSKDLSPRQRMLKLAAVAPELLAFVKKQHAEMNCICGLKSKLAGTQFETDLECTKCVAEKLIAKAEGAK